MKRNGKVYLVVKVKGNGHKYATLRVKPLGKHGRKLGTWTKKVRTGKTIKHPGLVEGGSGPGVACPVNGRAKPSA